MIRKALLLGFEAEEYERLVDMLAKPNKAFMEPVYKLEWRFCYDGIWRDGYATLYSAAFDYCRLCGLPDNVIGDFRG